MTKEDDVRQYVIKRPLVVKEGKKPKHKAPKIQRLITPVMLQRKRHRVAIKRRRAEKNRQVQSYLQFYTITANSVIMNFSGIPNSGSGSFEDK